MRGGRCSERRSRSAASSRSCSPCPCCPCATPESCWRPTATSARRSAGRCSPVGGPGRSACARPPGHLHVELRRGRGDRSVRPDAGTATRLQRSQRVRAWGPPPDRPGPVMVVGLDAAALARSFAGCRLVLHVDNGAGVDNDERGAPVSLCREHVVPGRRSGAGCATSTRPCRTTARRGREPTLH